jgi:hypothetical protein
MKNILTIVLFLCSIALWAQNKSTSKSGDFYLEYSSSTKTIIIKGNSLVLQEWIEQYDNPVSSMPGSRKEVKKTAVLSQGELARLKSTIRANSFMNLPKNEYGAVLGERYYPTTISVMTGGKQKKVLYKSNPAPETEQAPKAFNEVEKEVNELIAGIKQWK